MGTPIQIPVDFVSEITKAREQWKNTFIVLKECY